MMYKLSAISSRKNFGQLLTWNGLLGHAAEIGTHRGDFAFDLMSNWSGTLACIDPWDNLPGYEQQAKTLWGDAKTRQEDYEACLSTLSKFKNRILFMRTTSREASRQFADSSLDFIHIDGDHTKVGQDLHLWWPKLRHSGILVVHDWFCPNVPYDIDWARWVQPELYELAKQENQDICLLPEPNDLPWSAYIQRR